MQCSRHQSCVSSFLRCLLIEFDGLFFVHVPVAISEDVVFIVSEFVMICVWIMIVPKVYLIVSE